jgi:hemerythrin
MTVLIEWSPALVLNLPKLDETHHEMADLINAVSEALAKDREPILAFGRLLAHTEAHFAMEEGWMAATGFEPENCHSRQHAMVLDVMREVLAHAHSQKDLEPMQHLAIELAEWLPQHAEMMDAALVYHMDQLGYDPLTGHIAKPPSADAAPISSCGSASCT